MKLIVVADPHIGIESNESQAADTANHLRQAVEHINSHHADADYCLFIGDLTNDGEIEAYRRFEKMIKPLHVPVLLMIGNHDTRENFQSIFPQAHRDKNGFVQFVLDLGADYRLIGLDSLKAPPYIRPERHVGLLCPQRTAFLESSLKKANERNVIIAMHHHPFRVGLPYMDAFRLENENEFMELVESFPNIKMLLIGHIHRAISGVVQGIPFACFKSSDVQGPLDFKTIDPTSSVAEPPSYGVLLLSEGKILIHNEDFTAGANRMSKWETIKQNYPQVAEDFLKIVERMLPEKVEI